MKRKDFSPLPRGEKDGFSKCTPICTGFCSSFQGRNLLFSCTLHLKKESSCTGFVFLVVRPIRRSNEYIEETNKNICVFLSFSFFSLFYRLPDHSHGVKIPLSGEICNKSKEVFCKKERTETDKKNSGLQSEKTRPEFQESQACGYDDRGLRVW